MNEEILNEYFMERNLGKKTRKSKRGVLNKYSRFNKMTLQELLDEADIEEEQGIRMKKRKIKQRINNFKKYLIKNELSSTTINTQLTIIKSFYRHYDIEIPNIISIKKEVHETIKDIPTKKDIKNVLESTNNLKHKAIILFMFSSGCARNEVSNITIGDFIEATKDYHDETNIKKVIEVLENKNYIVPTFQIVRKKTNTPYFTFCTPEATNAIIRYLKGNLRCMDKESPLFGMDVGGIGGMFIRLNDKLNLGWKKNRRFFHSHSLRKAFATTLYNSNLDPMTIDFLSGRSIDSTHDAYFKADPEKLKNKYMYFMDKLTVYNTGGINSALNRSERMEYESLKQKYSNNEKELEELKGMLFTLKKRIDSI
ncbi:tyrosine-type recombinase/integrase [Methanosphaera cuniculi]|uniref:Tyrosine recombinase XerC n=1 Tax=Methanosphaera cuniculi TaxID=1077256 RepID=A0A2A2HDT0_9EURY|nr:site-specific integrase [Methanosphaera cuniculi]PAV07557.1 hypothetical protein ASJ82_07730 [Methanosphaera cuniculi]PWL08124.1 tyrosine recombinase XerC [Methanosphaera cuniculi]